MAMAPSKPPSVSSYEKALRADVSQYLSNPAAPRWLHEYRQAGWSRFETLGFPTRKWEPWKYVNLRPILHDGFTPSPQTTPWQKPDAFSQESLQPFLVIQDNRPVHRLVFINGRFIPEWSQLMPATSGAEIIPLSTAVETHGETLKKAWLPPMAEEANPFRAINATYFQDGVYIALQDGIQLSTPVELMFVSVGDPHTPRVSYPRLFITLGKGASMTLATQFVGIQPGFHVSPAYLTNVVTDIQLDDDARLDFTTIYRDETSGMTLASCRSTLGARAELYGNSIALNGATIRHESQVQFNQPEAKAHLYGLNVLTGESQFHAHTEILHQVPHCQSDQVFKGILDGKSRSEYDGVVRVARDAHHTDARQLNKNLLLSNDAQVYTRPWLWIDNDDVKCAHGATVGQLNEDEVFYLTSRGLNAEVARCFMTFGFAEDLLLKVSDHSIRRYLERRVLESLGQSSNPTDCWMSCEWKIPQKFKI